MNETCGPIPATLQSQAYHEPHGAHCFKYHRKPDEVSKIEEDEDAEM